MAPYSRMAADQNRSTPSCSVRLVPGAGCDPGWRPSAREWRKGTFLSASVQPRSGTALSSELA